MGESIFNKEFLKDFIVLDCSIFLSSFFRSNISQGSDFSHFIRSDQKVAPYHLVVF